MQDKWFQSFKPRNNNNGLVPEQPVYLFCFPHAGGATSFFHPWVEILPGWVKLVAIQLPGRWNRVQEAPFVRMDSLIAAFGPIFAEYLTTNNVKQYAIYGHSLGGLIAYELIKYLKKENYLLPYHLFISSKRSPQMPTKGLQIYHLPDLQFEQAITKLYGALPAEIAGESEMKKVFLDITKKDMELLDTYTFSDQDQKINIPTSILGGTDDHTITINELKPWEQLISDNCEFLQLPGGHFFMKQSAKELLELLIQRLAAIKPNELYNVK